MSKKRNKPSIPASKIPGDTKIYRQRLETGILRTIAFMRIIDETILMLQKTKQLPKMLELELMTGLRMGHKILTEHFEMTKNQISAIYESIDKEFVDSKRAELYRVLSRRIITPDQPGFMDTMKKHEMKFDINAR